MKRFASIAALAIAVTTLIGCSRKDVAPSAPATAASATAAVSGAPLKPLDLLIDWQAEPTYLGVYYAKSIGAFSALGFDVNIVQSWGANEAALAVSAGKYKLSTASGAATVIADSNGAQLLSTAVLYPRLPTAIYSLESTGIRKPKDLEGRTVGIYAKSVTNNEFEAFAKLNGVDIKKVKIVALSGPDLPLILSRKVDAVLNYFELSPTQLALQNKVSVMMLDDYGVKGYGLNVITSRSAYAKEPEVISGLTQAILRGYREGCADQEKAVASFTQGFPDKDPVYVKQSWAKVCGYLGTNIGEQTEQGWKQTADLYASLGLLAKDVIPASLLAGGTAK
jgi:NitT/TauT family transport system substrate-binding protein